MLGVMQIVAGFDGLKFVNIYRNAELLISVVVINDGGVEEYKEIWSR